MLWHSLDSNFTENTQDIYHWNDKFTQLRLKSNLPWANELITILPNSIALKWKEKRDKTPAPQIIFGSAHPIDKVGQYLIYVKYCSPQRSPPPHVVDHFTPWEPHWKVLHHNATGGSCITRASSIRILTLIFVKWLITVFNSTILILDICSLSQKETRAALKHQITLSCLD